MTVSAVRHLQRMRGGSQSHMMLCDDNNVYIVKFQNNPQGIKVLANELLATRLAEILGLSVTACEVIEVSEWLIAGTPELIMDKVWGAEACQAGLQFGSRVAGGIMPGLVFNDLEDDLLLQVQNIEQFAGMLVFDKWTGNADYRQAVFSRKLGQPRLKANFIDQGYCFNVNWSFKDVPSNGICHRQLVYRHVAGWESFQPWLERVERFDKRQLQTIANAIPPEWYSGNTAALERLVQLLIERREKVRELIFSFVSLVPKRFPRWPNLRPGLGVRYREND